MVSEPTPPRFAQSAVIPYRRLDDGTYEVLLVTSHRRRRWVVPKGLLEPGLTPAESALNEAREEAGVLAEDPAGPIGRYEYKKWGGVCDVEVYAVTPSAVPVTVIVPCWSPASGR